MKVVGNLLRAKPILPHDQPIGAVAVSGLTVAAGSHDGCVSEWDVAAQRAVLTRKDYRHGKAVNVVRLSPGGRLLASGGSDGIAVIADRTNGATRVVEHAVDVESMIFSVDGRFLFTGGTNAEGRIWETATGRRVAVLEHGSTVGAAANYGDLIVTGCNDRRVRLWTWSGQLVADSVIADGPLKSIAAIAEGLAIGSHDGSITWTDPELRRRSVMARFSTTPKSMDADGEGRLVVACYDGIIRLFAVKPVEGSVEARLLWSAHEPKAWGHAVATNGVVMVAGSFDGAPVVYRLDHQPVASAPVPRRIRVPRAPAAGINAMALQPERSRVLVAGDRGAVQAIPLAGSGRSRLDRPPVATLESAVTDVKAISGGAVVATWGGEIACLDTDGCERWRARWPDGQMRTPCPVLKLDVGAERIVAGLYTGGGALIDLQSGVVTDLVGEATGAVKAAATQGKYFALTGRYDPLRIGLVSTGQITARVPLACSVSDAVTFCPWRCGGEPTRLAVTAGPNEVWLIDLHETSGGLQAHVIHRSGGHDLPIKALLFVNRDVVLAGDYEGRLVAHTAGKSDYLLSRLPTRLGVSALARILDDRVAWATFDGAIGIVSTRGL